MAVVGGTARVALAGVLLVVVAQSVAVVVTVTTVETAVCHCCEEGLERAGS